MNSWQTSFVARGWVRNDSDHEVLLRRDNGPYVSGFDETNYRIWVQYAKFEVDVPDTFRLQPGESATWFVDDTLSEDSVQRTDWIYGSPEVPMLATWNRSNLSTCPGPVQSATYSHGPQYDF